MVYRGHTKHTITLHEVLISGSMSIWARPYSAHSGRGPSRANESPYESAKVVERKSGEYASYFAASSVLSGVRIWETSYELPLRSKDVREEGGMYLAYHVLV